MYRTEIDPQTNKKQTFGYQRGKGGAYTPYYI